jgi:DNA polymerase IIIc chi subunit
VSLEPRVIFFSVRSAQEKIDRLTEVALEYFQKKERLLFFVEDDRGLQFVDDLLWSYPKESFLPHSIASEDTKEWIAITKGKINLTQAKTAFNLCSTPLLVEMALIYDFEDQTNPQKQMRSQIRFEAYRKANLITIN